MQTDQWPQNDKLVSIYHNKKVKYMVSMVVARENKSPPFSE